jgi:hypothetical protein
MLNVKENRNLFIFIFGILIFIVLALFGRSTYLNYWSAKEISNDEYSVLKLIKSNDDSYFIGLPKFHAMDDLGFVNKLDDAVKDNIVTNSEYKELLATYKIAAINNSDRIAKTGIVK